jgi:hypothetical protein
MGWRLKPWHLIVMGVSVFLLLLVWALQRAKKKPEPGGMEVWYTSPTEPNGYVALHNRGEVITVDGSVFCFGFNKTGEWAVVECTSDQKRIFQSGQPITVTNLRADPSVANWVSLRGDGGMPEYHTVGLNEDPLYPETWEGWFKIVQGPCLGPQPDPLPVSNVTGISVHDRSTTLNTQC